MSNDNKTPDSVDMDSPNVNKTSCEERVRQARIQELEDLVAQLDHNGTARSLSANKLKDRLDTLRSQE